MESRYSSRTRCGLANRASGNQRVTGPGEKGARTMKELGFSTQPGAYERQLRRRAGNPLFPPARRAVTAADVKHARLQDLEAARAVEREFRAILDVAANLDRRADMEALFQLKLRIDLCYAGCAGLPGGAPEMKQALRRLVQAVDRVQRKAAGNDPVALGELAEEGEAREEHFRLQDVALVADLTREDPIVAADELVATLLTETPDDAATAFALFDDAQRRQIRDQARFIVAGADSDDPCVANARLVLARFDVLCRGGEPGEDTKH